MNEPKATIKQYRYPDALKIQHPTLVIEVPGYTAPETNCDMPAMIVVIAPTAEDMSKAMQEAVGFTTDQLRYDDNIPFLIDPIGKYNTDTQIFLLVFGGDSYNAIETMISLYPHLDQEQIKQIYDLVCKEQY
jgi:hypothetical protein